MFRSVLPDLLKFGSENFAAFHTAFEDNGAMELVRKFIGEASCTSFLVERVVIKKEQGEEKAHVAYSFANAVDYTKGRVTSVVFLKKGLVIEEEKSISSQLRAISLSEGSVYETLQCYVSAALTPSFECFVMESGKAGRDGNKATATSLDKKIAVLEMGLFHLQQNVDIPEINLVVHPTVAQVIKCKVADFGDEMFDSTFLNALQNQVIFDESNKNNIKLSN